MTAEIAVAAPNEASSPAIALETVYELVANDFAAVNQLIPAQLTSDVDLVEEIGRATLSVVEIGAFKREQLKIADELRQEVVRRETVASSLRFADAFPEIPDEPKFLGRLFP